MSDWSAHELDAVDAAEELQISVEGADGTSRPWVTIWAVRVGDQVFVRTWYRRDDGWFGRVLESRRARIRVPGAERTVTVEDVGGDRTRPFADVDAAYRTKYGRYGAATVDRMVSADAAATTLRLTPGPAVGPG